MEGKIYQKGPRMAYMSGIAILEIGISRIDGSDYPKLIFNTSEQAITKVEEFKEGDLVKVTFDIHGKYYSGRDGNEYNKIVLNITDIKPLTVIGPIAEETSVIQSNEDSKDKTTIL